MNGFDLEKADLILRACSRKGDVYLGRGLCLMTAAVLMAEQAAWEDEDLAKNSDFSRSPFWLCGVGAGEAPPEAIREPADLLEALDECEFDGADFRDMLESDPELRALICAESLDDQAAAAPAAPLKRI